MRKLLFFFLAASLQGMPADAQWRLGPELGFNMSNIREIIAGNNNSNSLLPGARLGCIFDHEYNDHFSFQPGVFFSMMGCYTPGSNTYSYGVTTVVPNVSTSIYYAHVPINFLYKTGLGSGNIFIGAGPYLAWGVYGVVKSDAYNVGAQSGPAMSENIKFGSDSSSFRALDYGFNIVAGYELPSGLLFRAGYSYGLGNLSNESGLKENNTCIFLSMGWLLGGPNYR